MKQLAVEIKCQGAEVIDIDDIVHFQGNLKDLSKDNYDKLRKQILELGFSEPISVWKNDGKYYAINGHQRLRVLTEMRKAEKIVIPPIPISIIEAKSELEAKKKVLALTSQFGEMTNEGLFEFISDAKITIDDLSDFKFADVDLDVFKVEFFDAPILPGTEEEQGALDEKTKHQCPECGCEF